MSVAESFDPQWGVDPYFSCGTHTALLLTLELQPPALLSLTVLQPVFPHCAPLCDMVLYGSNYWYVTMYGTEVQLSITIKSDLNVGFYRMLDSNSLKGENISVATSQHLAFNHVLITA